MKKHNNIILIVIAVVFTVVFLPTLISWASSKYKFEKNSSYFTRGNIQQITISRDFRDPPILIITDQASCKTFYDAASKQESYLPNHPQYELQLSVVITLKSGDPVQIIISTIKDQNYAYCQYVSSTGAATHYFGTFKSQDLYNWLIGRNLTAPDSSPKH